MSTIRATYVQHGSSAVPNITLNASGQVIVASGIVSSGTFAAPSGSVSAPGIYFNGDSNTGLYSPAADTIAFTEGGVEALRIDSSGRVGIGSSSPAQLLHLKGSSDVRILLNSTNNASDRGVYFATNTDSEILGYIKQEYSTGKLEISSGSGSYGSIVSFRTGGTSDRVVIDSSGRLGIGNTAPGALLDLGSATVTQGYIKLRSTGSGAREANIYSPAGGGLTIDTNSYAYPVLIQADTVQFGTGSSGTERARIDSSGRLLVGTSSARTNFYNTAAAAALQIEGADSNAGRLSVTTNFSTATDGAAGQVVLSRSGSTTVGSNTLVANNNWLGLVSFQGADGTEFVEAAQIRAEVDGTPGANDMPGRLVFSVTRDGQASPTEAMRIVSSGAFKFSTSGSYLSATNTANEFTQSNDNDGLVVRATSGTFINDVVQIRASRNTTNATFYALSYYNDGAGAYRLRIADSGNVLNTNNSYGALSDFKLKENIVNATSQWSDIKALQVRKYNFKEETGQQTHTQIGLIAQEVELVSPGLVTESPDRDAEGNDLGTVTKSVNYSVLYMKAVKALQEAMERIEQLEATNADLLARVTVLESA